MKDEVVNLARLKQLSPIVTLHFVVLCIAPVCLQQAFLEASADALPVQLMPKKLKPEDDSLVIFPAICRFSIFGSLVRENMSDAASFLLISFSKILVALAKETLHKCVIELTAKTLSIDETNEPRHHRI